MRSDYTLRDASLEDAAGLLALLRELVAEPEPGVPLALDELAPTVDDHRAKLGELLANPRARMVIAEASSELVGHASLKPVSPRRALAHAGTIGLGVSGAWRRRGVARALMQGLIAGAPAAGYTRLELHVYARNTAAIALYDELGFAREGVCRRAIREGDTYLDDVVMARLL